MLDQAWIACHVHGLYPHWFIEGKWQCKACDAAPAPAHGPAPEAADAGVLGARELDFLAETARWLTEERDRLRAARGDA